MNLTQFRHFYFNTFANILIVSGALFFLLAFGPLVRDEIWYKLKDLKGQKYGLGLVGGQEDSVFARFLTSKPVFLEPVNTEFSLVIEKIGVNSPVIRDVTVSDEKRYNEALKQGIAHAAVSDYPSSEAGNTYLFAHASINFWELGKYATVFNLLRKLENNDLIHVIYENQIFVYRVVDKEVMKGWNTFPLTRPVIEPTLTLQTCDPPGTTLNRLVVTATLMETAAL